MNTKKSYKKFLLIILYIENRNKNRNMIKLFEEFSKESEVEVDYYENGQKWYEKWYFNGEFHREDGPSIQEWYENGQKEKKIWHLNGKLHRENGPAVQWWYENGQKWYEYWYINGQLHKEDGPVFQSWFENGQKQFEEWFLNNKEYSREEWINKLKEIGSEHYEEQEMLYNAEKYNL